MSNLLVLDALLTSLLIGSVAVAAVCALWVLPWTDAELDADARTLRHDWDRLARALPRHRAELTAALDAPRSAEPAVFGARQAA